MEILIIVAITIIASVGIICYYKYKNPYVEEIIKSTSMYAESMVTGQRTRDFQRLRIKRTYKNGKVIYITKDE